MILTVSWQSPWTGKGNKGWKIVGLTASPRLGMIMNPALFGATMRAWEKPAEAMPCEPAVEGGASDSRQVKANSEYRALFHVVTR